MEDLEQDWGRKIWKRRKLEDMGEAEPLTDAEELHDFDEFVLKNWQPAHIGVTMQDY